MRSERRGQCVVRAKKGCQAKSALLQNEDSFTDLRDTLAARGLSASQTILAGLIEGEDESQYGVILTAGGKCILFEIASNSSVARWEIIDEPDALTSDFQAVSVGMSMISKGQIS